VIDHNEGGEVRRLHLTVDQGDLASLREQLDRAEKKVRGLVGEVGKLGVPVLVAGDEGS